MEKIEVWVSSCWGRREILELCPEMVSEKGAEKEWVARISRARDTKCAGFWIDLLLLSINLTPQKTWWLKALLPFTMLSLSTHSGVPDGITPWIWLYWSFLPWTIDVERARNGVQALVLQSGWTSQRGYPYPGAEELRVSLQRRGPEAKFSELLIK